MQDDMDEVIVSVVEVSETSSESVPTPSSFLLNVKSIGYNHYRPEINKDRKAIENFMTQSFPDVPITDETDKAALKNIKYFDEI